MVRGDKWSFRKFAGRDDDIVLGVYKRGIKLAHNLHQILRCISKRRVEEDHINLTIKGATTYEVVVGGVVERKTLKMELGTKV